MRWKSWSARILPGRHYVTAQQLPHLRYQGFKARFANYFMETISCSGPSVLLVDLINVIVGGAVGMTIPVSHPYFLLYNAIPARVQRGVSHEPWRAQGRPDLSHAKYDTHCIGSREIAYNPLHLKSTDSQALLIKKTDQLLDTYVDVEDQIRHSDPAIPGLSRVASHRA